MSNISAGQQYLQRQVAAETRTHNIEHTCKRYAHLSRGEIISILIDEYGLSTAGASTYYANCRYIPTKTTFPVVTFVVFVCVVMLLVA